MSMRARSTRRPAADATTEASAATTAQYSFAGFWSCALQVNPSTYQATYPGQDHGHDEDAYNQALLKKCVELDIRVVGIADRRCTLDALRL